ncbi:tripartite tricarboxylate transporter substrate binding protein [Acetobacteraceae bacterium H6797]|nr:tripartite tricarboxylate transporter substrate binding protein [Acetobacteraceae bacterium H6797]
MKTSFRRLALGLTLSTLGALGAANAWAQTFPDRPIRLLVPFGPGGGTDVVSRLTADAASRTLGQSVIVENRAGGGGVVGIQALTQARPDGYTLAVCPPICVTAQSLYAKAPFEAAKDFAPVITMADLPLVLVVRNDLGVSNVQELIAKAKSTAQGLSYASPGAGSSNHLAAETLRMASGAEMVNVPYRSGAAALTDVMAGRVDFYFDTVASALPQIREGKVKALGVTGGARAVQLPDVPTMTEAGLTGFELSPRAVIVAPAGTPPDVISKLHDAFRQALANEELKQKMITAGAVAGGDTPAEAMAYLTGEAARLGKIIRDNKISAE